MKDAYETKEPFNIKKASYELYKIFWARTHISPELEEITRQCYEAYVKEMARIKHEARSYIDWIYDAGIAEGSIWVSYEEFLANEYQDRETMLEIYDDDEILIEEYDNDTDYDRDGEEYDV